MELFQLFHCCFSRFVVNFFILLSSMTPIKLPILFIILITVGSTAEVVLAVYPKSIFQSHF